MCFQTFLIFLGPGKLSIWFLCLQIFLQRYHVHARLLSPSFVTSGNFPSKTVTKAKRALILLCVYGYHRFLTERSITNVLKSLRILIHKSLGSRHKTFESKFYDFKISRHREKLMNHVSRTCFPMIGLIMRPWRTPD